MPAWLVTITTAKPRAVEQPDGVDAVRKEHEPLEPIEIAGLFDERAVTIEKYRRLSSSTVRRASARLAEPCRDRAEHRVDVMPFMQR